jgi:type IV secretion system protein VirB10
MSDATVQMSPDASPVVISKKSGVRRVNNVPMLLVGAALAAFLVVMALVAADRAARQHQSDKGPQPQAASTEMFAKRLLANRLADWWSQCAAGNAQPAETP